MIEKPEKIKVYLSGPITIQPEDFEQRFNELETKVNSLSFSQRFIKTANESIFEAVNPTKTEQSLVPENEKWTQNSWFVFIKKDLDLIQTCDTILLMPDWDISPGCTVEYIAAKKLGLGELFLDRIGNVSHSPLLEGRYTFEAVNNFKSISYVPKVFYEKLAKWVEYFS